MKIVPIVRLCRQPCWALGHAFLRQQYSRAVQVVLDGRGRGFGNPEELAGAC
jgi:hypothetical protein